MIEKRFLYVGGFQLPDKNAAAHRVLSVAKILNLLDYEVVFLDVDENLSYSGLRESKVEDRYTTYSQQRPRKIKSWINYILNPLHVEEVLEKYTDWAGVIAYNYPAAALYKLKNICHRRNIKIYADCTEWYNYGFALTVRKIALKIDTCIRMRFVQKKLDGLIVVSNYLYQYYKKYLPVVVLPPLVDKTDSKWEIEEKESHGQEVRLAYVGSPGKSKDKLDVIIRSVCSCKSDRVKLYIAGISKEEYLKNYPEEKDMIDSIYGTRRIFFLGRLPHPEALNVVKGCDYTVFYRQVTRVSMAGFPTKFVESISCGIPVITNKTSDLNQYLKNGKNGFMLSADRFEEELISLVEKLVLEKEKKCDVESQIFDFRSYKIIMEKWLRIYG